MAIEIKAAQATDLPALAALSAEVFANSAEQWTQTRLRDLAGAPDGFLHLACEDRQVAGFIVARGIETEVEILTVAVAASHRRQGLGRQLLGACLAWARVRQAEKVFLEVAEGNLAALELYRRAGFVDLGRRRHYYGENHDALVLGFQIKRDKA